MQNGVFPWRLLKVRNLMFILHQHENKDNLLSSFEIIFSGFWTFNKKSSMKLSFYHLARTQLWHQQQQQQQPSNPSTSSNNVEDENEWKDSGLSAHTKVLVWPYWTKVRGRRFMPTFWNIIKATSLKIRNQTATKENFYTQSRRTIPTTFSRFTCIEFLFLPYPNNLYWNEVLLWNSELHFKDIDKKFSGD